MVIVTGNFANNPNPDEIKDGDIVENFNLMQAMPDTPILTGKNVTLKGSGNLINCTLHSGITLDGSFNRCKKDCCGHLHDWSELHEPHPLPLEYPCVEECRHWLGADIDENGDLVNEYKDITL